MGCWSLGHGKEQFILMGPPIEGSRRKEGARCIAGVASRTVRTHPASASS